MATFSIALSGLTAANSALDITSNNIANSNTIGFKSSAAEFADVYSSGAVNLNNSTAGEGVRLVTAAQQFTQGNISTTSGALDLAISGNGFFTLNSPNGNVYTRNGQFSEDANGNVVSDTGQFLQVYPPLANGGFNTGALSNLNLNTAQSAPVQTTAGNVILNLPSNATPPTQAPFNPAEFEHLYAVDLDDGVRLARQFLSGDFLLQSDRGPGSMDREPHHQRHRRGRRAGAAVLQHRRPDRARERHADLCRLRASGRCAGHDRGIQFRQDHPVRRRSSA